MAVSDHVNLDEFMAGLVRRNPGETEFHQAVYEVAANVFDYIADKEIYHEAQILRRIAEPDRIISFRVCWEDDSGNIRVNRGFRVQNNNSIGPLQGWTALPPQRESEHSEVSRLRADVQKQSDRAPDGRRQRRRGLQPKRQI